MPANCGTSYKNSSRSSHRSQLYFFVNFFPLCIFLHFSEINYVHIYPEHFIYTEIIEPLEQKTLTIYEEIF